MTGRFGVGGRRDTRNSKYIKLTEALLDKEWADEKVEGMYITKIDLDAFVVMKVIGRGAFSKVYLVK